MLCICILMYSFMTDVDDRLVTFMCVWFVYICVYTAHDWCGCLVCTLFCLYVSANVCMSVCLCGMIRGGCSCVKCFACTCVFTETRKRGDSRTYDLTCEHMNICAYVCINTWQSDAVCSYMC